MLIYTLLYMTTAQSTSLGPVCYTFHSEILKPSQQLAGMYCMHVQKGASEAPIQSILNLRGVPPDPLTQSISLFIFALGLTIHLSSPRCHC